MTMTFHRHIAAANDLGSRAFIGMTQWAVRRGLVRRPSLDTDEVGEGAFRYRVQRDFCRTTLERHPIENAHEMVFDAAGRLYLLTDHPQNNVLVFDPDGEVVDAWTLGMRGAHGLTLATEEGREVLYICDAYGPRVVKCTLSGEVLMTLPSPHDLGVYRAHEPYLPTQSAVAPNGDIYVADGYGSQRVLRFDAGGSFVQAFGGKGRGPGTLAYAHGVAVDPRRGPGRETLLVTSRARQCFERFDLAGNHLETIALPGGYPCRPVLRGDYLYTALCWSGAHLRPNSGFVVVLDPENHVTATLGGHLQEGRLVSDYSVFHHAHDVAVNGDGDVFVAEWNAGHRYPVALRRV